MPGSVQVIERAAAILRLVARSPGPLGVVQIANSLELAKGTTHGILRTLQGVGFIEQDLHTGKYRLGAALVELGSSHRDANELRSRSINSSDSLAARGGEAVSVGILPSAVWPFRPAGIGVAARRVTLSDVARRAGVSRTTASFVITGRRDMGISADATQRVLQAAHELSYRPNLLARGLRSNLTHTIGLVSDTIATTPYAGEVIRGGVTAALLREHLLFIGETEGDTTVEKRVIQGMLDRGVDRFLYASMFTREATPPAALRGHPLVLLNCVSKDRKTPAVVPDEPEAGRTAVRTLLAAGHHEGIVLVGETPHRVIAARERLAGVTEVLSHQRLSLAGTIDSLWWPEPAYEAIRRFLATGNRATGLICLNDRVAMGAYQAIQEAGLNIPDDVSIVSFDDSDLATWLRPQLTSIAIPHFELGRRAVELLLSNPRAGDVERVPMPLRHRASVGPPRPSR